MTIIEFTPLPALAGGALIGLAAAGLWWLLGRLAGVSTILGAVLVSRDVEISWRVAFIGGLLLAGVIGTVVFPDWIHFEQEAGPLQVTLAGLLVGIGTQIGSGCTSGHGVCGVSRLSARSIIATLLFMGAGMATVYLWKHAL
jgi:uncharacterized membrane protein YedE/YeeE